MQTTLAIIAALVAALSALFAGFQIRFVAKETKLLADSNEQSNALAATSELRQVTVHLHAVLSNFLQYPELRPYFYHGVDERSLDDESRFKVETLAEVLGDVLEGGLFTTKLHPETNSYDDWAHYSRDVLVQSPCLRRMISEHSTWWSLLYDFLAPLDIASEPSTQQSTNSGLDEAPQTTPGA